MKINTALILCAGYGKRLNPLTLDTPKPLLKLNEKTLLETCIRLLEKMEIKKILINTFYLEEQIIDFIKKRKSNSKIEIIKDGKLILNTGGGILNMISKSQEEDFLVLNPDTLWNLSYLDDIKKMEKFYYSNNIKNILLLVKKTLSFDKDLRGDFELKSNIVKKSELNNYNFTGCQIINKSNFKGYNVENFSINEIWQNLLSNEELFGFETKNKFYHLTNLKVYKNLLKN